MHPGRVQRIQTDPLPRARTTSSTSGSPAPSTRPGSSTPPCREPGSGRTTTPARQAGSPALAASTSARRPTRTTPTRTRRRSSGRPRHDGAGERLPGLRVPLAARQLPRLWNAHRAACRPHGGLRAGHCAVEFVPRQRRGSAVLRGGPEQRRRLLQPVCAGKPRAGDPHTPGAPAAGAPVHRQRARAGAVEWCRNRRCRG